MSYEGRQFVDQARAAIAKLTAAYASAAFSNDPSTLIDQITVGIIRALDAQTAADQPDPLVVSGGRPHSSLIGVDTNHNVIHHGGIGGSALNGEGGQLNFFGGDYRIPGCPPVLCGEVGYTWLFDYDLDPVSGLPRTPYALRFHSGVNPNTGARTRLVLQGYDDATLESEFGNVGISVRPGKAITLALQTSGSGYGMVRAHMAGYVRHTGNVAQVIDFPAIVPLTKLADVKAYAVQKTTDFNGRDVYGVRFSWFSTVVALVEDVATLGGYKSPTGRVSFTDNGTQLRAVCTGLNDGLVRDTTIHLVCDIQQ